VLVRATTSGEFSIGSTKVPINQTITLQGGAVSTGKLNEYFLLPAKDGNSLSKTALNVPGGLAGIVNCEEIKGNWFFETLERNACKAIFENKTTGVTANDQTCRQHDQSGNSQSRQPCPRIWACVDIAGQGASENPLLGDGCFCT
jgi:hypothetical protein